MHNLTARDISRSAIVTRWHMVQTLRSQSLSSHLYLVTMFSLILINKAFGSYHPNGLNRELVMEYALTHDLPEVITGDIPTPLKNRIRSMGGGEILNTMEDGVDERITYLRKKAKGTAEGTIVKLADLIEAISYLNGYGKGNHARLVEELLTIDLKELVNKAKEDWPMGNWSNAVDSIMNDLTSGIDTMLQYEVESRTEPNEGK